MKQLNPPILTDKSHPWGVITFIHTDGEEHSFYSVVNELTGDRLSAFDKSAPMIDQPLSWAKSMFKSIRAKAQVTGFSGSKHFEDNSI